MMNPAQIRRLITLTNSLSRDYSHSRFSFSVTTIEGDEAVIFSATNIYTDFRWFETVHDFYAIIGPRGGVRKYEGSINA